MLIRKTVYTCICVWAILRWGDCRRAKITLDENNPIYSSLNPLRILYYKAVISISQWMNDWQQRRQTWGVFNRAQSARKRSPKLPKPATQIESALCWTHLRHTSIILLFDTNHWYPKFIVLLKWLFNIFPYNLYTIFSIQFVY